MKLCRTFTLLLPIAVAAGAVTAVPAPAAAQVSRPTANLYIPGAMGIPQPESLVTLNLQNRSLARILSEMFKQVPHDYQLLADTGTTVYSINVTRTPLSKALITLLAQDKRPDPLVFSYVKGLAGKGTFVIDREFIQIGMQDGERRVSLANARITRVLPEIFKVMKVQGRIEPDIPPVTIGLQLRPEDWSEVLPQVLLEASKVEPNLTYSMDGDTYVVHLHKTPTGLGGTAGTAPGALRRVKLEVANAPLKDALAALFKDSRWKYQVSDKVKDVNITYAATSEPELAALYGVLKQVAVQGEQVTYREGNGVLYIEPGPLPGDIVVRSKSAANSVTRTSLVRNDKLSSIAKILSDVYKTPIHLAPNVPDLPVSFKIQNATLDEALQALVTAGKTSLPNLSVRPDKNGFLLGLGN